MAFDSGGNLACYPTVTGADCPNTNSQGSHQQLCDFRPASNGPVNLAGADLRGAIFSGKNLTEQFRGDIHGSNLALANLRWADLQNTILTNANLGDADFEYANLTGATLTGANKGGVDWFMATCPDGTVVTSPAGHC